MSHYFDNCDNGICLKCDMCRNSRCCPDIKDECNGKNWDFLKRIPKYIKKIKEERNL